MYVCMYSCVCMCVCVCVCVCVCANTVRKGTSEDKDQIEYGGRVKTEYGGFATLSNLLPQAPEHSRAVQFTPADQRGTHRSSMCMTVR